MVRRSDRLSLCYLLTCVYDTLAKFLMMMMMMMMMMIIVIIIKSFAPEAVTVDQRPTTQATHGIRLHRRCWISYVCRILPLPFKPEVVMQREERLRETKGHLR